MQIKRPVIFPVFFLLLLSTSCRKSPVTQPAPVPVPVINALSKVDYGGGDYDSLYYNSDLQVIKVVSHTNIFTPYDQVFTFEYDANKRLTRIVDHSGERYDYIYSNGVLAGVNHYVGNNKLDFKIYDFTNGKLTNIEEYYQIGLNAPGYEFASELEFEYYPDGNLKKQTTYGFTQARTKYKMYSTTYADYDTKQNPVSFLGRFTFYSQLDIQKNNPGKMIHKDEVNGNESNYNYSYTYNDFLNPATLQVTGSGITSSIKYYYY